MSNDDNGEMMMVEPVRRTIEVGCDPATAFEIFTARMSVWWPLERNTVSAMSGEAARSVALEPRVGGRVYEIKADGAREDWAVVRTFEPGKRLVLAWHVMAPESEATEVEVRFVPSGEGTRVELEHRGFEILGSDAEARRDSYDGGWVHVFEERFAEACASA